MQSTKRPDPTAAERQRRRKERLKAQGGRRVAVVLTPAAANALDTLTERTGASQSEVVSDALTEAAKGAPPCPAA